MKAEDRGAPAVDTIDDMNLPERSAIVERRAGDVAEQVGQCLLGARLGQGNMMEMVVESVRSAAADERRRL